MDELRRVPVPYLVFGLRVGEAHCLGTQKVGELSDAGAWMLVACSDAGVEDRTVEEVAAADVGCEECHCEGM
jgi:hypothetical protein